MGRQRRVVLRMQNELRTIHTRMWTLVCASGFQSTAFRGLCTQLLHIPVFSYCGIRKNGGLIFTLAQW